MRDRVIQAATLRQKLTSMPMPHETRTSVRTPVLPKSLHGRNMKIARAAFCLFLFALLLSTAYADTVVLKNGNTLNGTIDSLDKKELVLDIYKGGEVKIDRAQVKEIKSDTTIYVTASGKRKVSGQASTQGENLVIQTTSGPVSIPFAEVENIRSQHQQDLYEGSLHPGLDQNWKGAANLGFALARGNSDTTNLNIGMNAARKTPSDGITLRFSSVYAKNNEPGEGVTANTILAGIRYDRTISGRLFAFVAADYTHDPLQFLNLRQIYSGGLGFHAINNPNTTFDVLAGANYTRESYSAGATANGVTAVDRNLPGLTAGEDFMHKFGASTVVTEDFTFYPQLNDLSQYRFSFNAGASTKIHKWLGWQITLSDQYVTDPPVLGTKSNDLILSTGLNVTFDTTPK